MNIRARLAKMEATAAPREVHPLARITEYMRQRRGDAGETYHVPSADEVVQGRERMRQAMTNISAAIRTFEARYGRRSRA